MAHDIRGAEDIGQPLLYGDLMRDMMDHLPEPLECKAGHSSLCLEAENGNIEVVGHLIKSGCDVNAVSPLSGGSEIYCTALHREHLEMTI